MRITRTKLYQEICKLMALRGTCERNQVGCVVVREGRIIATGYNSSPTGTSHCSDVGCLIDSDTGGCVRTIHAEAGAISFAAKHGIALDGSTLYVTLSPCLDCAKLILNAGIEKVFFGTGYRKVEGVNFLRGAGVEVEEWGVSE